MEYIQELTRHQTLTLALGAVAVAVSTGYCVQRLKGDMLFDQDRSRLTHVGIYVCGALLWPLAVALIAELCDFKIELDTPIKLAAYAVPPIYLLLNALLARSRHRRGMERSEYVRGTGLTITGVVFTASMLMNGYHSPERSSSVQKMYMAALLCAVLLVLPSPDVQRETYSGTLLTSTQNVAAAYALGLFATAATA